MAPWEGLGGPPESVGMVAGSPGGGSLLLEGPWVVGPALLIHRLFILCPEGPQNPS